MKTTLEKKYDFSHEALCDDKKRKQLYDDCEAEVLSRLESKTAVGVAGAMIGFSAAHAQTKSDLSGKRRVQSRF